MTTKTMYHLTPNGPGECTATKIACPYSNDSHFGNPQDAEKAFAERFNQPSLKKSYAPAHSSFSKPTKAEALVLLDELREANPKVPILKGSLVSFSQFGSVLYNLDHPKSDNDLFMVTDLKVKGDFQTIDSTKRDIRVSSIYTFVDEYKRGLHFNVDIFHTDNFQKASDTPWAAYMNSARFQSYEYIERLRNLSKVFTDGASKRNDDSHRAMKFLKTALRNEILANRYERESTIRPVFDANEREDFYRTFEQISKEYIDHTDPQALVSQAASKIS